MHSWHLHDRRLVILPSPVNFRSRKPCTCIRHWLQVVAQIHPVSHGKSIVRVKAEVSIEITRKTVRAEGRWVLT